MGKPGTPESARLLFNGDEQGWFGQICVGITDPAQLKRTLEEDFVDKLAQAGVDQVSICLWSWFKCLGRSSVAEKRNGRDFWDCWDPLYEAGEDPVSIMLNRCHQRGMSFIAGMRMNDRHNDKVCPKGSFIMDNPQWQLRVGGGTAINYQYEPVRQEILNYIEDMLARYDVDGVEFDYMRWCHMFEPGTGSQHADELTDFTRKTRALLDAAAGKRGRDRLLLGVRVPQTLAECHYLGFDVETWIKEGLVDYVCPSRFISTGFNCPVDDFARLTRGTSCKVYPSVHPNIGMGILPLLAGKPAQAEPMQPADYRAAARNFFAFGADGLQTYNIFSFAGVRQVAQMLDQAVVDGQDRRYVYYPYLWGGAGFGPEPTDFIHKSVITLQRVKQVPPVSGSMRLRIAEDLTDRKLTAALKFKAVGLGNGDTLQLQLNGHDIPARFISRSLERYEDIAYYEYSVKLHRSAVAPFLQRGDNTLVVSLPTDWLPGERVLIGDFEIHVSVEH